MFCLIFSGKCRDLLLVFETVHQDNTQWLILKAQELWPQHQQQVRDWRKPCGYWGHVKWLKTINSWIWTVGFYIHPYICTFYLPLINWCLEGLVSEIWRSEKYISMKISQCECTTWFKKNKQFFSWWVLNCNPCIPHARPPHVVKWCKFIWFHWEFISAAHPLDRSMDCGTVSWWIHIERGTSSAFLWMTFILGFFQGENFNISVDRELTSVAPRSQLYISPEGETFHIHPDTTTFHWWSQYTMPALCSLSKAPWWNLEWKLQSLSQL